MDGWKENSRSQLSTDLEEENNWKGENGPSVKDSVFNVESFSKLQKSSDAKLVLNLSPHPSLHAL